MQYDIDDMRALQIVVLLALALVAAGAVRAAQWIARARKQASKPLPRTIETPR